MLSGTILHVPKGMPSKMSSYKTLTYTYPITAPTRTPFQRFQCSAGSVWKLVSWVNSFEHLLIFGSLYFDTVFQHLWSLVLISQQHLSSHFSTVIGNDEFKNIWHLFSLNFQKWLTWPNLTITNIPTETSVSTVGTLYSYWVFENCGTDNNMATDTLVCHRTRVFTQTGKTGTRKHSDRHFYFCLIHIQRKCRLSFHCNTCRSVLRDFSWLLFASTRNYFCQHQ